MIINGLETMEINRLEVGHIIVYDEALVLVQAVTVINPLVMLVTDGRSSLFVLRNEKYNVAKDKQSAMERYYRQYDLVRRQKVSVQA